MTASLYSHFTSNYNASNYRVGGKQFMKRASETVKHVLLFGLRKTKSNLSYDRVSPDLKTRTYQIQVNNFQFQFSYVKCFRKVLGIKRFFFFGNLTRLLITESAGPCECHTITSPLYQVPLQSLSSLC